jgi:hypothetical protein
VALQPMFTVPAAVLILLIVNSFRDGISSMVKYIRIWLKIVCALGTTVNVPISLLAYADRFILAIGIGELFCGIEVFQLYNIPSELNVVHPINKGIHVFFIINLRLH